MAFLDDFKKFAFKGNVVDLAVGVVIATAFGKIVTAVVADVVMPLVGLALPAGDWRDAGIVLRHAADPKQNLVLKYGDLMGSVLDFLVVALALFIIVTRIVKNAESKLGFGAAPPASTKECPFCFETVPMKARRCKSCTSELEVPPEPKPPVVAAKTKRARP